MRFYSKLVRPSKGLILMLIALLTLSRVSPARFADDDYKDEQDDEAVAKLEEYKASPYYVPLFDPEYISAPQLLLDFVREMIEDNERLYLVIIDDLVDARGNIIAIARVAERHGWAFYRSLAHLKEGIEELGEENRQPIKPEFWIYMANFIDEVVNRSSELIEEREYTEDVDTDKIHDRVKAIFTYIQKIIFASPVSGYVKWSECILFREKDSKPEDEVSLKEEAADIFAHIRVIGYEAAAEILKRIAQGMRKEAQKTIDEQNQRFKLIYMPDRMSKYTNKYKVPRCMRRHTS